MQMHFTMDLNGAGRELDRLSAGPAETTRIELESVLAGLFAATQQYVHVQTGSLRSSGKVDSKYLDETWHGELSYGGESAGVHNPVEYAEIEQSRGLNNGFGTTHQGKRTGDHDFMTPTYGTDALYAEAVLSYLRGDG